MKDRRALWLVCALALLCAGVFLGRMSALWGGAVLRAENGPVPALPALAAEERTLPPAAGTLNINEATAAELRELPGIGETLAARIVEYRTENGPFESVEELLAVQGIGPGTLAGFSEYVTAE